MRAGHVIVVALLIGSTLTSARPAKVAPAPATVPAPLTPAQSIRAGVEKWRAGAYPEAVALWQPSAATGDPDAMFNMGQAYKLGRGVTADPMIARDYYRKAAAKGHLPAQANLGISLFQTGEKPEAVRWLRQAADRGEARAQYVLGIAAFNGDGLPRAVGLGYGYLLRSAASGLPQASTALTTIEPGLSPADRTTGEAVAASLASGKGVPVASGPRMITSPPSPSTTLLRTAPPIAAPPLIKAPPPPSVPLSVASVLGAFRPDVPVPERTNQRVNSPTTKVTAAPAMVAGAPPAANQLAQSVGKAMTNTMVERPALSDSMTNTIVQADASAKTAAKIANSTAMTADAGIKAANAGAKPAVKPGLLATTPKPFTFLTSDLPPPKRADTWRVQLGAFSQRQLADAALAQVPKTEIGGAVKPIFASDGPVTKLQLGPYPTRDAARSACAKLAGAGRACFVTAG